MTEIEQARNRLRPFVERAEHFSGWHFPEFEPHDISPGPPWSYPERAAELLTNTRFVLDMGTGGGEVFADLLLHYRGRAVATEEWHVNAPIAASRLRPLGAEVIRCRSVVLPFRDGVFDVVLNRHEEIDPGEVARVLAPRGRFLTQQVGREQWKELRAFLPRRRDFGDLFHRYQEGLRDSGLTIIRARSHAWDVAYRGLGDIVFMLCVAPWEVPNFDPLGDDLEGLLDLERALSTERGIILTESRFLVEALKSA